MSRRERVDFPVDLAPVRRIMGSEVEALREMDLRREVWLWGAERMGVGVVLVKRGVKVVPSWVPQMLVKVGSRRPMLRRGEAQGAIRSSM